MIHIKVSLTKTIKLNPILVDKTFAINCAETIISKLADENGELVSTHIQVTSLDYEYYSFTSIENLKMNLSNKVSISELELTFFLTSDTHIWINFRSDHNSDLNPKGYIVDISVSSNNSIYAEDILKSFLMLFSNNKFIFCNNDKSNLKSADNIAVNLPDNYSIKTTTSKDERDYQEQKENDAKKHDFKNEIILLIIGAIIGVVFNFIYKLLVSR